MRRALFLLKSPPYGTLRATEGYRAAMGTSAMGTPTALVLVGDGIYAALRGQCSDEIDQTCVESLLEGLHETGVEVYLHGPSLHERGLEAGSVLDFPVLTAADLADLIRGSHAVMTF